MVTSEIEVRLVAPGSAPLPVQADCRYDAQDPYAVNVAFHAGSGEIVEWTFARQLLTDGVTHATGDGDVQVWPATGGRERTVCLALTSPSGHALFEMGLDQVIEFLARTYSVVPSGRESEHIDLDNELASLLWGGPAV